MASKSQSKQCFAVMPIRSPGTDEHALFAAIYNEGIKAVMETELGFTCVRADEVSEAGSINADIIRRIANSDVVVADLTDVNPNVFYEVGIRHALRGRGTILVIDEARTPNIPFDLSSYRTIKYQGTLVGIKNLRNSLRAFVSSIEGKAEGYCDSPVHDTFGFLPDNIIDAQSGSTEGKLRQQLAEASQQLAAFEKRVGKSASVEDITVADPVERLRVIKNQADALSLPPQLSEECALFFRNRQIKEFVDAAVRLCSAQDNHSPDLFLSIATMANSLGLSGLAVAIYDRALEVFPGQQSLTENRVSHLLTAALPQEREKIRAELLAAWEVTVSPDGAYVVPKTFPVDQIFLAARFCDSLRRDNRHIEGFSFVEKLVQIFDSNPMIVRNYAAALRDKGLRQESYAYYKKAMLNGSPRSNYMTAHWWASDLNNSGQLLEATQIQIAGCLLNLDYSASWSFLAKLLSYIEKYSSVDLEVVLADLRTEDLVEVSRCAMSCSDVSIETARAVAAALNVSEEQAYRLSREPLSLKERKACADKLQAIFGSRYFESCTAAA